MRRNVRTGLDASEIKRDLIDNLFYLLGKFPEVATPNDWYIAVAYTVRDRLLDRWVQSAYHYYEDKTRTVCYLSAEFLIGPQLGMNLLRLNSEKAFRQAVNELGLNLDDLIEHEEEPGLGNGGLGRLAACFMESMATLQVPAIGYGIRYEFGIFDQEISDGWQLEVADQWLRLGNPWEIARPDIRFDVTSAVTPKHIETRGSDIAYAGFPAKLFRELPTTLPCSATASIRRIYCGCGKRRLSVPSTSVSSMPVIITVRYTTRSSRKISPRFFTPMTSPR